MSCGRSRSCKGPGAFGKLRDRKETAEQGRQEEPRTQAAGTLAVRNRVMGSG